MKASQNLVIYSFLFMCVTSIIISGKNVNGLFSFNQTQFDNKSTQIDENFSKSFLNFGQIYFLKEQKPFFEIDANKLYYEEETKKITGEITNGFIYRNGSNPIKFKSYFAEIFTEIKNINLKNEVEVINQDLKVLSDALSIFENGNEVKAYNHVKTYRIDSETKDEIKIFSNEAWFNNTNSVLKYFGNVNGFIKRNKKYEESLSFIANEIDFNNETHVATFNGNIQLNKGNYKAMANRGEIFLQNYNKKLKYYGLYDDVKLEENYIDQNDHALKKRKAFAEKLEGFVAEKKIVLTGLPKVIQGNDVIKGNKITIRENIEIVEVEDANTNIIIEKN